MAKPQICDPDHTILIDAHCHTFNASDLPAFGFIYRSVLGGEDEGFKRILKPLVRLLTRVVRDAPGAEEERQRLDQLGSTADFSLTDPSLLDMTAPATADGLGGVFSDDGLGGVMSDAALQHEIEEALAEALAELETSIDAADLDSTETDSGDVVRHLEDRELYQALIREAEEVRESGDVPAEDLPAVPGPTALSVPASPAAAFGSPLGTAALATLLVRGGRILGRYIRWVGLLRRFRYEIVAKLMHLYGRDHGCIDLFTPAQVDLDRWLDDTIGTSHDDQVELMERVIRLSKGRVHALAAFDPWRECDAPGQPHGSLARVQRAVMERGFVGVKIYPPMGFQALGNTEVEFTKLAHIANTADSKVFGGKLDEALLTLYRWCEDEGVPLMAHCMESLGSRPGWDERASPMYWMPVVERFPRLRLNLAHFGGPQNLIDLDPQNRNGWTDTIGVLMQRPGSNVYADIGHFDEIADEHERRRFFDGLETFFIHYPEAEDRLMFGTDWLLLGKEKGAKHYLQVFADDLLARFGAATAGKILGGNAAHYLGLYPGDPNRLRLEAYWAQHEILAPEWTARLP